MDLLPTLVNALVIALVGALVTYMTRTQIQDLWEEVRDLKGEMKQGFTEVRRDMRAVETQLRSELRAEAASLRSEFRAEFASVRSDLTQIALAVGAQPRPQAG
ncbi:MAG: hypothetical protein ACREA0_29405 [bacterium]